MASISKFVRLSSPPCYKFRIDLSLRTFKQADLTEKCAAGWKHPSHHPKNGRLSAFQAFPSPPVSLTDFFVHERQFNFAPPTAALLALLNAKFGRLGPGLSTGHVKDVHVSKSHQCKLVFVLFLMLMYFLDGAGLTNIPKSPNLYWIIRLFREASSKER